MNEFNHTPCAQDTIPETKTRIVLSRRELERIVIADGEIVVTIMRARNGVARVCIEAPRRIRVQREELLAAFAGTRDNETPACSPGGE